MAVYKTNNEELELIADAIRSRNGSDAEMSFPNGFKNGIDAIASTCNVAANQILNDKTAFTKNGKVTGTISSKAAATYNASTSDREIDAGQYLSGTQTIRGITTANISAGNIKEGVVITVGDTGSSTRIKNVTGTCIPATLPGGTFMPFMWRNGDGTIPAFNSHKDSSGTAAQTTSGYKVYWPAGQSQGNHRFRLPCDITFTYFTSESATSSKTVKLVSGTTYRFFQYDPNDRGWGKIRYDDGTDICNVWKIVSWAVT